MLVGRIMQCSWRYFWRLDARSTASVALILLIACLFVSSVPEITSNGTLFVAYLQCHFEITSILVMTALPALGVFLVDVARTGFPPPWFEAWSLVPIFIGPAADLALAPPQAAADRRQGRAASAA
ncbi:hypothetical protein [Blastochloris sulfoviridis]|uniref:Uncharacterized protein n=1 Tax=Blastochloris sulfoviridis TaxID=50712 RepID=A0A5M6HU70_9HYPH|nr:hypothetical protein [Blastochloris sulfoviridis]KAA5599188.1 hypothetical protein F1193_12675 [Blastochloris sulfoviridis]